MANENEKITSRDVDFAKKYNLLWIKNLKN